MILESDFFFNGIPRWNLGWATPNYAGAFLVTLLCFLWVVHGNKHKWYALGIALLLETALYFLIAKTFSRGALLAVIAGVVFFIASSCWRALALSWRLWALRAFIFCACVIGTGLFSRIDPGHLTADGAVTNRLGLWRGGMEMIASSPWVGWGAGESGRAYMNWFQDVDRSEIYTTMVNSYLHVAVEYGLIFFIFVSLGLFSILAMAWRSARSGDALAGAAGASLSTWAVANIFTTLWIEPGLWIIPSIAIGLVIWKSFTRPGAGIRWLKAAALNVGFSILSAGVLFVGGKMSMQRYGWKIHHYHGGSVELIAGAANKKSLPVWHLWADTAVFGPTPGKELRRWAVKTGNIIIYLHPAESKSTEKIIINKGLSDINVILSGCYSERLMEYASLDIKAFWILHPSSMPPTLKNKSKFDNKLVVVLPKIDERGLNTVWMEWAQKANARITISPDSGFDIRSVWPDTAPVMNGI